MASPITVDLPHSLGAAEAKRRIQNGIGRLGDFLPGDSSHVDHGWEGDRMTLKVSALNQEVSAMLDVQDKIVRVQVMLPAFLSFFADKVEKVLRRHGTELLEDRSGDKAR